MSSKRKILAVTGARSEYDIIYPILESVEKDPNLELEIVITGSHLAEGFGNTAQFIEADGFKIADRVYNLVNTDQKIGRIVSLGNQIAGLAQSFHRVQPDIILAVGDREEAVSVTMTAAYMDIPCAHLFGGDIAKDGNIDNQVRYAASKFAHIHFTGHPKHSRTLELLGEDTWRIHYTGNPALDRFASVENIDKAEISKRLDFDITGGDYLFVILHPIITEFENEFNNAMEMLRALEQTGLKVILNSPNSDAGFLQIKEAYETCKGNDNFYFFHNLDRVTYINLLRHASCMIGNSSSGLLEAPSVGLPVVNVGPRQRDRLHSNNVIFVDYKQEDIYNAIQKSMTDEAYKQAIKETKNPYGAGDSAERIVKILKEVELNKELVHKNITYDFKDYE